jgi:hypothetical protein
MTKLFEALIRGWHVCLNEKDLERGERIFGYVGEIVRKLSRSGIRSKALCMKEKGSKIQ